MTTETVFRENEIQANKLVSIFMLLLAAVLLLCWPMNAVGIFDIRNEYVLPAFLVSSIMLVWPALVCIACRGEKKWNKFMLLLSVTAVLAYLDIILTYNVPLAIVLPVILSCRYYSHHITVKMTVLTTVLFALSAYLGAIYNIDLPDKNFASSNITVYVRSVMLQSFLPRWMLFAVFSVFCCEIARNGRKMVLKQNEIAQKTAKIDAELDMAGRIQNRALPSVDSFPKSSLRNFDLAAEMLPAKEVGGDFYDFFYPDSEHLALIIADVADKGIAASLYMMMSKMLLDISISSDLSPGRVLESANRYLFDHSPRGMFVTAWIGILNLSTGELVASSAGHEAPVLCRKGGAFEQISAQHGSVLGGRKSLRFPEYTIRLGEGDALFVYTDGISEANDMNGEMFGIDRMIRSLNRCKEESMNTLISGIKSDISSFAGKAPQFDDMTMIAFRFCQSAEDQS